MLKMDMEKTIVTKARRTVQHRGTVHTWTQRQQGLVKLLNNKLKMHYFFLFFSPFPWLNAELVSAELRISLQKFLLVQKKPPEEKKQLSLQQVTTQYQTHFCAHLVEMCKKNTKKKS